MLLQIVSLTFGLRLSVLCNVVELLQEASIVFPWMPLDFGVNDPVTGPSQEIASPDTLVDLAPSMLLPLKAF